MCENRQGHAHPEEVHSLWCWHLARTKYTLWNGTTQELPKHPSMTLTSSKVNLGNINSRSTLPVNQSPAIMSKAQALPYMRQGTASGRLATTMEIIRESYPPQNPHRGKQQAISIFPCFYSHPGQNENWRVENTPNMHVLPYSWGRAETYPKHHSQAPSDPLHGLCSANVPLHPLGSNKHTVTYKIHVAQWQKIKG